MKEFFFRAMSLTLKKNNFYAFWKCFNHLEIDETFLEH